jgi:hypothetical protein
VESREESWGSTSSIFSLVLVDLTTRRTNFFVPTKSGWIRCDSPRKSYIYLSEYTPLVLWKVKF